MKNKNILEVAKLGRVVGLRGDLKLHLLCDFLDQFCKGETFYIEKRGEVVVKNFDANRMLIRFEGYENREVAQGLVNGILQTSIEKTRQNCKLKDNEFFWFDMIGLEVFEDDLCLGKVEEIERIGAQDYLKISTHANLLKEHVKSFLIPYIDRFVIKTDMDLKVIQVKDCFDILKSS